MGKLPDERAVSAAFGLRGASGLACVLGHRAAATSNESHVRRGTVAAISSGGASKHPSVESATVASATIASTIAASTVSAAVCVLQVWICGVRVDVAVR